MTPPYYLNHMIRVSVIIPIYKIESFIAHCAETLLSQSLKDVEYIFVDDASPDCSVKILQEVVAHHPEREGFITLLHNTKNQGSSAARNAGLKVARGKYIFFCDGDDFVEPNMLEKLYETAEREQADIVWSDWYLSFGRNERYMPQPDYSTPAEAVKGMLSGAMKFVVWNKLARRNLYTENQIQFPNGYNMGEDMTMIILFDCARRVYHIPQAFYHYVKLNTSAYTNTKKTCHLEDLKYNVQRVADYLREKYGRDLEEEIGFLKLDVKFPYLISNSSESFLTWKSLFPEANCYIGKNRRISIRARFLQCCALKGYFLFIRVHYLLVQKIVYGLIYR